MTQIPLVAVVLRVNTRIGASPVLWCRAVGHPHLRPLDRFSWPRVECVGRQPLAESIRAVERGDREGARVRVEVIYEERLVTCGEIRERERLARRCGRGRNALYVLLHLTFPLR